MVVPGPGQARRCKAGASSGGVWPTLCLHVPARYHVDRARRLQCLYPATSCPCIGCVVWGICHSALA